MTGRKGAAKEALRRFCRGKAGSASVPTKIATYFILTGLGFVFIYPLLYMVSVSLMDTADLVDATVTWVPTHFTLEGFKKAARTLEFWDGLKDSLIMTVIPAGLQTLTLAMAGYGLARYPVPGKKLWVLLAVFIFLIPSQVTTIPRFLLFNAYKLVGTIWPMYLICLLGQAMMEFMTGPLEMEKEAASTWTSVELVLLSVLLTGWNIYPKLVKFGGAGALVPITGFANSVAAPAIEFQAEGEVFGVGCKIFTIAGPVILYGVLASWVLGLVYWGGRLVGMM